jgi:hypothetical protein
MRQTVATTTATEVTNARGARSLVVFGTSLLAGSGLAQPH